MMNIARAASLGARQAWLWRYRDAFGASEQTAQTEPTGQRRLLVDVSTIIRHDAQTGIQRVVRAVWSELLRQSGADFLVVPVYATNAQGYCYAPVDFLSGNYGRFGSEPVCVRPGDKFLGLDLSAHLLPKYRRQLRAWRAHGATIHLIVYDLLPLLRPDWFNSAMVGHFRKWFDVLQQDVDQAICISDQVAHDLRERVSPAGQRHLSIGRLQMAADIAASVPSSGICSDVRQLLERVRFRPAVLMVGTIEPRKGYDVAIAAFEHLWRTCPKDAPDLIIVGKGGWKTTGLQDYLRSHPERGKRLHWLDRVTDEGLCLFYEACSGVFVASRGEGFGLPLIEAALHRRHVLARDIPVFREQKLPNVRYFGADSPEALSRDLIDLVAVAETGPPPATTTTRNWAWSVQILMEELGLPREEQVPPPLLRAAS
jgi:glycosyltransferase involved in cell wall biosynthesis